MRRLLLAGVILAFPIGALSVGFAGQASATSIRNPSTGVTCTKISANILTGKNAKIKGCSDTANTGGKGKASIATLTSGAGSIKWASGHGTTTVSGGMFTSITPDACPSPEAEYEITFNVTGGTGAAAGSILAGWTVQAYVCVNTTSGAVALLAGTTLQIGPGL